MSLEDAMAKEMALAALKGKALALRMMETIRADDQDPPIVIHAVAFIFAGMLSAIDGQTTAWEEMGYGLIGDDERLALFTIEVRELVKQLRAQRPKDTTPRPM